jgi:tetratricopeptide (TPR) repeat protein
MADERIKSLTKEITNLKNSKFRKIFSFIYYDDTRDQIYNLLDDLIQYYLYKKDYNTCIELYLDQLNYTDSNNSDIYENIGNMYYKNKDYNKAIDNYILASTKLIKYEKLPKLFMKIAESYNNIQNIENAILYYKKVIEYYSEDHSFDITKIKLLIVDLYYKLIMDFRNSGNTSISTFSYNTIYSNLINLYSEISEFYLNRNNIKFVAREYITKEILCMLSITDNNISDLISAKIKFNQYKSKHSWISDSIEFNFLQNLFNVLERDEFDVEAFRVVITKFDEIKRLDPVYLHLLTEIKNNNTDSNNVIPLIEL